MSQEMTAFWDGNFYRPDALLGTKPIVKALTAIRSTLSTIIKSQYTPAQCLYVVLATDTIWQQATLP